MEKIKNYIERFNKGRKKNLKYAMTFNEFEIFANQVQKNPCDWNNLLSSISTIFNFGYAKGYRAAMAEIKKGGAA